MLQDLLGASVVKLITGYQRFVSPWLAPRCRFSPTCSQYAKGAIMQYGTVHGLRLAFFRLLKCHPWHEGGMDSLPSAAKGCP